MNGDKRWWGESSLPHGKILNWRIGPFRLWLQRLEAEYRLAHQLEGDPSDDQVQCEQLPDGVDLLSMEHSIRFAMARPPEQIELRPALADRSVVARPEKPMLIPPGEDVHLYIHSPLWLILNSGKKQTPLVDMPLVRPSDTWFGPNTREGELCYASRSFFQLRLDDLRPLPHRASTPVLLRNRATAPLELERIQVPVHHLSLFTDEDGRIWTQEITLSRDKADDFASVQIKDRAHSKTKLKRIAEPRERTGGNIVLRAFSSLFD